MTRATRKGSRGSPTRTAWCGPDDCGYPYEPCDTCDETCDVRLHRHMHSTGGRFRGIEVPNTSTRRTKPPPKETR